MNDDSSHFRGTTQFEGYLLKRSQHLKSLRKRWIVLNENYLLSYTEKEDVQKKNIRGTFDLNIYDDIKLIDYNHNNNAHSFKIISSKTKEEREFITKTKQEQQNWFHQIQLAQDILHERLRILKCSINKNEYI